MNDYEYCLSLAIEGGERPPDELTKLFGVKPTASHRQGDLRTTRGGKPREGVWPHNFWSREVPVVANASLSESVADFLIAMRPLTPEFFSLVASGAEISLFVGVFANRLCDDRFPPSTLKELGELGVALRLDYYSNDAVRTLVDDV